MSGLPDVAIVGTGTMAPGIAVAFAAAGAGVTVAGRSGERVTAALQRAAAMAELLADHELGPAAADVRGRMRGTDDLADLSASRVVVEAVSEDLGVKRAVLTALEAVVSPDVVLATNTSGLRVTDIAAPLVHPERVVAMHFWNPAHLMPI